ncbi:Hypothetical predicted protein [Pelobates cultripes]|uniref:Uncharacterized protein n=1 Tax=Pelobates cultripes TaxID=61616 RepID=A0AAD1RFV3_PELCU|nr:Hypothetical predicted protein [Pelobates cultripes]
MEETVIKQFLMEQLEAFSSKMMAGWTAGLASLKKDIRDLGATTSCIEEKMEESLDAHNQLAAHVNTLQSTILTMEHKLMDIEARACRNNLRLRNIPETVTLAELQAYLHDFFHALSPGHLLCCF